jgi:D-glycero-alpha-D-manno-heptose-7-phosphate kinase
MILARAPMRITLGGGGTDLPSYYSKFGGFILSTAIDKYVYIYVNRPAADDLIRVKYSRYEEVSDSEQIKHDLVRPALKLLKINNNVEIVSMVWAHRAPTWSVC